MIKYLGLFWCAFICTACFSQPNPRIDSTVIANIDSITVTKQQIFTPEEADTLVSQIEHLHTTLHNITNWSTYNQTTSRIKSALPGLQTNLDIISRDLPYYEATHQIKNLQMFNVLLYDMQQQLGQWRATLTQTTRLLIRMQAEMRQFSRDSFLRKISSDTSFRNLYYNELKSLDRKWLRARALTSRRLQSIESLQGSVSSAYFQSIELRDHILARKAHTNANLFKQEGNYLWQFKNDAATPKPESGEGLSTNKGLSILLLYYLNSRWHIGGWIMLIALCFFGWIFLNYRIAKKHEKKAEVKSQFAGDPNFEYTYLHPLPFLATAVLVFNIAPLFDANPPALYIETLQFILLMSLTILFHKVWDKQTFRYWLCIFALFIMNAAFNAILSDGLLLRLLLAGFNVVSVVFGFLFYRRISRSMPFPMLIRAIVPFFITLNLIAIIGNILGRITLAKLITTSAILGLTQIIGLTTTMLIVDETLYLQIRVSRIRSGHASNFDYSKIQPGLNNLLITVGLLIWLIIFFINLGIYHQVAAFVLSILSAKHQIGTIVFTWSNILIFALVLFVSSLLQKYISYFLGGSGEDFIEDTNKQGTRIVVLRLLLIVGGFIIAIVASGLPLDKITVVLGALSVGIGLGLQSIVNNFVSGIILLFEKPVQVGDYIELGTRKGRVRDIGIRASKLTSTEGAQIIIPNADILSGQVVNWSFNKLRMVEMEFTIDPAQQLETAKEAIAEALKQNKAVAQNRNAEILVTKLTEQTAVLKIQVWLNNIDHEQRFKSNLLADIHEQLLAKGIKVTG